MKTHAWGRIAGFDRALQHWIDDKSTYGRSVESLRSLTGREGLNSESKFRQHICLTTSFSFSTNFDASSIGDGPNLKVPSGFVALPKKVKMSPLVSIPLTPVPLIFSRSVIVCSKSRRCTEGKTGREGSALRTTVLWSTEKKKNNNKLSLGSAGVFRSINKIFD